MAGRLYFDGRVVDGSDPVTLPLSSAMLYGKGIFTTVAINKGQPVLWAKHWARLEAAAVRLNLDISEHPEETSLVELHELLSINEVLNGRARLTFYDLRPGSVWASKTARKSALAIVTSDLKAVPEHFRLGLSPHSVNSRSPLAGIKSCNYLENLMAIEEAKSRGFHEAIRVNERRKVTSGCMSNVFWLKDNGLFTPSVKTGCLAGTTREYVLENLDCREVEAEIGHLRGADAIFLASAGLGIVRVAVFAGRDLPDTEHPILDLWPPKDAKTRTPTNNYP